MKRTIKSIIALVCALAMLAASSVLAIGSETETTTTGYMEFGSYPQTEIVSQASDSGVYGKDWAAESDYIVDEALYNTLTNLSEDQWDANGDTTVDGSKYRRIKEADATYIKSNSSHKKGDDEEEDVTPLHYDWADADTYHYFKYEPIKWRILEQSDDEAFLLSETILDCQKYNINIESDFTWETCTVRSWLNGYDSSQNAFDMDYSSNSFIATAFTAQEQAKIKTTTLENKDNSKNGIEGGNNTDDKIYFLSEDEVYDITITEDEERDTTPTAYGFARGLKVDDIARQAESSTYAKAMGVANDKANENEKESSEYLGTHRIWWLRSPGSQNRLSAVVNIGGSVYRGGVHANSKTIGVRPALRLSLVEDEPETETNIVISANSGSVAYRTKVTLKAKADGMAADSYLAIYEGNTQLAKGNAGVGEVSYYIGEMKDSKNYSVKIIDANGNILYDANGQALQKDISVTVNAGFFQKLIAFFKGLFGLLSSKTIEP